MNLTLLSVEKKVGVGKEYLEAIESGEWQVLPGEVYARNFLRRYAVFLGLSGEKILQKFKDETRNQNFWPRVQNYRFGIIPKKFFNLPKFLKNIGVGIVAITVVFYLGFQTWSLLKPPRIEVLYPEDNYVSRAGEIKMLGRAENGSIVTINGETVMIDKSGFFTIDINLNKGLNVIKLEAKKKYGRNAVVFRSVVVEEKNQPVAAK
ncbi:hypothetical protein GYA54_04815 [Candidatus Kuenenbacteria bacterium]|nr:hypothetical protein [Candidatus Kuenenbacteria bacterium]